MRIQVADAFIPGAQPVGYGCRYCGEFSFVTLLYYNHTEFQAVLKV